MKSRMWLVGAVVVASACISRAADDPADTGAAAANASSADPSSANPSSTLSATRVFQERGNGPQAGPLNLGSQGGGINSKPANDSAVSLNQATFPPLLLSLAADPESVYAPPAPPRDDDGINQGGVNVDLRARYVTDYIYRGVDRSDVSRHDKDLNLQFDAKLSFNLGKLPHPFIGVFANVFDSDPISHFQEVRPSFGFDWTLRPFTFTFGNNTYLYPERDEFGTSEIFGQVVFDDSILWHSEHPIFSPYAYGAYDYDENHGWYIEGGVKHDFVFEDYGIVLTASADIAALQHYATQFIFTSRQDSGFQHYDVGLTAAYSLNRLFNFSKRYGEFDLEGYLYYTGSLDQRMLANNELWGGAGVSFHY